MARKVKNPEPAPAAKPETPAQGSLRARIVEALMALAADTPFGEITISQIAAKAEVSLADFRDAFPSKGAVLAGYSRNIDRIVLDGISADLKDESSKDRLFDVLMRRLDAMAPHKAALQEIVRWAKREPLSASALNRMALNSMRFMLEAAGIDSEGPLGALKLQGLVIAWTRVLSVWFRDGDAGLAETMAALDKELDRGATIVARAEDLHRLTAPLRAMAEGLLNARRGFRGGEGRSRSRYARDEDEAEARAS